MYVCMDVRELLLYWKSIDIIVGVPAATPQPLFQLDYGSKSRSTALLKELGFLFSRALLLFLPFFLSRALSGCLLYLVFVLKQHPDFEEEQMPEWLLDVPDPAQAEEWEMLSFYRFVDIDHPEAFANMLQVRGGVTMARGHSRDHSS